jgi:uncharacterized membrane protein
VEGQWYGKCRDNKRQSQLLIHPITPIIIIIMFIIMVAFTFSRFKIPSGREEGEKERGERDSFLNDKWGE